MKKYRIGFGHTKNTGNYQNDRVYIEAELEEWESVEESMDQLRSEVARELNVRGQLLNLKERTRKREELLDELNRQVEITEQKLEQAQRAWDNFSEFLTAHGVDPQTLTIEDFSAMRKLHTGASGQENTIAYYKYVAANSTESGFDYQPHTEGPDDDDDIDIINEEYEENPEYDPLSF